jgi:hypothetical protein
MNDEKKPAVTERPLDELVGRLREACNGHPHAEIPWPHRLLHDAADEIERLNTELQKRDKCSFIGPMRDCPTHGESEEIKRLREMYIPIGMLKTDE